MTDKTALYVSFGSLAVSVGSLIMSVVTGWQGRKQARQIAALLPASQAIDLLQKALASIETSRAVNPIAIDSMRDAKGRADLLFKDKVRGDLERLIKTAASLHRERTEGRDSAHQAIKALLSDLRTLIEQMNELAALR